MARGLLVVFALLASSPPLSADAPAPEGAPPRRPNILFISIDDLNDWTGMLGGHVNAKTPNLDRLADRGLLFTRAYASAPLCNASRVSLLTGVRPTTSGVHSNYQRFRDVMPDAVTLPQHFIANGYRVVGGGKIFHHGFKPDAASWQERFPSMTQSIPVDPKLRRGRPGSLPFKRWEDTYRYFDWGPLDVPDEAMGDAQVASWAVEELSKEHDRPFFIAVGFFRPHLPWYVPRQYFDRHPIEEIVLPETLENDLDDVPAMGRKIARRGKYHRRIVENGMWKEAVQGYLASISFADAMLGRVLDALWAGPHADDTIVVLWSDHGWHLGEKEHWRKFALWEEATRTPLILIAPGMTKPGTRCERTVSLLDLYPTLTDLAGLAAPPELEGTSLRPLLASPGAPWSRHALTSFKPGNHAVRSERWRYIRYADGGEELYDHDADPNEWKNLADDPRFAEVKRELSEWIPGAASPPKRETGQRP